MGESCRFRLDEESVDELLSADLVGWQCPHDSDDDSPYCPFHRPAGEVAPERIRDAFLAALDETGKQSKQFAGARLDAVDLEYVLVDAPDMYPIDLRYASVAGRLDLSNATLDQPLLLDGASLETVDAEGTTFRKMVSLVDADVESRFIAEDATFERDLTASGTRFRGDVRFDAARIEGSLVLADATFEVTADFYGCRCLGVAEFPYTSFDGWADFGQTVFRREAIFEAATFDDSQFAGATFDERGIFDGATFDQSNFTGIVADELSFAGAHFRGSAQFAECQLGADATFTDCTFEGTVSFERGVFDADAAFFGAEFEADAIFTDCACAGHATFEQVLFETLDFSGSRFGSLSIGHGITTLAGVSLTRTEYDDSTVVLEDATVQAGTLSQAQETEILYDLQGATLGEVEFRAVEDMDDLLEYFFVYDTKFEGFDFSEYRGHLAPEWILHSVGEGYEEPDLDPAGLEVTYLKARNGANAVGDTHSEAEFFIKEMRYRRRRYLAQLRDSSAGESLRVRLVLAWRVATNFLYDATSGFGERPFRVVASSLCTVVGFALLYLLTFELAGHADPYPSSIPFVGYLVFSFEGFVRFVVGGGTTVNNTFLRLLAELEGFVGGFFIGLFVFILTRAVDH